MQTLAAVLAESFALLNEGAIDPGSVWRYPALATNAPGGRPGVRTIVMRRFSAEQRVAELHTDARSPKMAALAHNPFAALHGWDPVRRVQLRLDGVITLADEPAVQRAWAALHDGSRATYAMPEAPGTPTTSPDRAMTLPRQDAGDDPDADGARRHFRVLELRFDALEYLSLAPRAHHRARFGWNGQTCDATWLVP